MFLNLEDATYGKRGIDLDQVFMYRDNSGNLSVNGPGFGLYLANGSADKAKFLDAMKSKKLLVLDNTSTDYYIVPSKLESYSVSTSPAETYISFVGAAQVGLTTITDATDRATFLAYVEAVGK